MLQIQPGTEARPARMPYFGWNKDSPTLSPLLTPIRNSEYRSSVRSLSNPRPTGTGTNTTEIRELQSLASSLAAFIISGLSAYIIILICPVFPNVLISIDKVALNSLKL